MLDYVIQCESSGDQSAIGSQGEIGILQFKPLTFDWLSEKYNFSGSIDNPEDQKELFLLAVEEHGELWTCYRKWLSARP